MQMNRLQIIQRVRAITRDFTNSIFREQDIIDFINEELTGSSKLYRNWAICKNFLLIRKSLY